MEDVAKDFLKELISRNLIQVASTIWEKVARCSIHDLLWELVIRKALEVNFFDIYDSKRRSISHSSRRHSIHGQAQRYLTLDFSKLNLRSVTFFEAANCRIDRMKFHNMFQHLYVLYLDNRNILPHEIGSLYHLKYLRLTCPCKIPSSIGNLKNLQSLHVLEADVRGKGFCQLPPEIADLINLRHLVVSYAQPVQRINKLTSLQVLKYIYCDQWKDVDPVDLVNLHELGMSEIQKSTSMNNISSLKNLRDLMLCCKFGESFPSFEYLTSCKKLHKLWLTGRIEELPLSVHFPNSITTMVLTHSELIEDPMPILGMLPHLRNFTLVRAYEGKEITCGDNSFCQLEFLYLADLPNLERWVVATTDMPLIIGYGIQDFPKLNNIPERMQDVTMLERMRFLRHI